MQAAKLEIVIPANHQVELSLPESLPAGPAEVIVLPVNDGGASEVELLEEINRGLPPALWERYRELTACRRDDSLTEAEHAELIATSDLIEEANARRIELVAQLARLRGQPLRAVMQELGLRPVDG